MLNVQREVLSDAVDATDIDLLFTSQYRGTLDELLGIFNLFANINTFGAAALEKIADEAFSDEVKQAGQAAAGIILALGAIARVFIEIVKVFIPDMSVRLSGIEQVLLSLKETAEGQPPADDIDIPALKTRINNVIRLLKNYLSLPHDSHHPGFDPDRRLGEMIREAQRALALLP